MNTETQQQFPPKHPQFILAADKSFFEGSYPYQKFGHHLHQGITPVDANQFHQAILGHTVLRRRYELDLSDTQLPYRQYLPYDVFGRMNRQFKREYFAYRRTPQAGESELHGKVSIGIGGHIDGHLALFDNDGVLMLPESIANSAMVERVQELHVYQQVNGEKTELHRGGKIERFSQWVKPSPFVNLLIDDGDNVGKRHFALVNFVNVPIEYDLGIAEEELESLGFLTYDELTSKNADGSAKYNLEGWTKICLEYFEKGARGPVGVQADMTDIQRGLQAQNLQERAAASAVALGNAMASDPLGVQAAIQERRERSEKIRSGTFEPAGEAVKAEGYVAIQDADSTEQFKEAVSTPVPATGDLGANPENQPAGSGSLTIKGDEVDMGEGGDHSLPHGGWLNHKQAGQVADALVASQTEDFKDAVNTPLASTGDLVPDAAHQPGGSGSLTLHNTEGSNQDLDGAQEKVEADKDTLANEQAANGAAQETMREGGELPVQDPLVDNNPNKELITDPSTIPTSDKPAE